MNYESFSLKYTHNWFLKRSVYIRWGCGLIHIFAVGAQVAASIDWLESEFMPLGATYISAAAIGLDAIVSSVRKERNYGPSIRNLSPGGWAVFGMMLWLIALPAYYIGARRRAKKNTLDLRALEPVDAIDWILCGTLIIIGIFLLLN